MDNTYKFNFSNRSSDVNLKENKQYQTLINWNRIMSILHLAQGIAMVFLGTMLTFSITIFGMWFDYTLIGIGTPPFLHPTELFTINNVGIVVSLFLFMSAIAHFYSGFIRKKQYIDNLIQKQNPYRWIEYSFSASTMMVIIALFFTIVDLATLILMFICIYIMNICGLIMEKININKDKIYWSPYLLGVVAFIAPWIIIIIHFCGALSYGGTPPDFVYAISIVEFILFSCFALVMVAYYRKWGKFQDYLYCEKVYQILSLVAKSMLAWIVFFGVFSPN